jgi:hypothetical protein
MATVKDVMLSVAQVCDLQPGDEQNATWINPGFSGVVSKIEKRPMKKGGFMWICELTDVNDANVFLSTSFFTAPKFGEGDLIEIFGKGLRRTEFKGAAQASTGKDTQVEVVARAANRGAVNRAPAPAPQNNHGPIGDTPAEAAALKWINGQTVGMAMKEAIALVVQSTKFMPHEADFWKAVKQTASNVIRVSQSLEKGHLSPAPWPVVGKVEPEAAPTPPPPQQGRSDPPKAAVRPQAGPGGSVAHDNDEADVPF